LLGRTEHRSRGQTSSRQGYNLHFHGSLPFYTQLNVLVNESTTPLLASYQRILSLEEDQKRRFGFANGEGQWLISAAG
jgi:hypothetical protein